MACVWGHTEIMKALLHTPQQCDKEGILNVLLVQDKYGGLALHRACYQGHTEIVKTLLHTLQECDEAGIQNVLMVQDKRGTMALHIAHWQSKDCGLGMCQEYCGAGYQY